MGVSILTVVSILVLAVIVFRRGPDTVIGTDRQAKWLLYIALVLMGIYAVFWLIFGAAEMISGDLSGVIHLLPSIMLAALMFLAWRRPIEGGVVLVCLGVLASLYYGLATMQGGRAFQITSLLGGVPYLLFGSLFLAAVVLARRKMKRLVQENEYPSSPGKP